MKSRISALMDGELDPGAAAEPLAALASEGEARQAWRLYHLIGDALRDTRILSGEFSQRLAERLAQEPTVLAPSALPQSTDRAPAPVLAAAASLAAVAMVGWLAFSPQEPPQPQVQVVSAPRPLAAAKPPATAVPAKEAVQVPLPSQARDYLLAHQGYSPRNSLQGMAPYARMVAGESGAPPR
jgi:sigma-E factor negative regulatory protein RseA